MKSVLFIICLSFAGCYGTRKSFDKVAETATIKTLEYYSIAAELKLDTAYIASVMDDRFISINSKNITTKHEELLSMYDNIDRRLKEEHYVDSFYLDEFRVDFFDNTAIVTFYIVSRGRIKGVPFENRRTKFYDVWMKRKKEWKLISLQATPITPR
jgi:hypothetical protein